MKDSSGFHRTSGDFSAISNVIWNEATFPADAGIFQSVVGAFLQRVCLPRERGDLSAKAAVVLPLPGCLPRERGDLSESHCQTKNFMKSSPHARGYFLVLPKW